MPTWSMRMGPESSVVDKTPGHSKSTRTSAAILVVRQTVVESFERGRSNVGCPTERLGPDFSFRWWIHRLQEATAASMAAAEMMAML